MLGCSRLHPWAKHTHERMCTHTIQSSTSNASLRLGGSNGVRQDWPLPWTHPEREESSLLIRTDNVSTLAEVEGEIEGCVEEECVFRGGGMHWGRPLSGGE